MDEGRAAYDVMHKVGYVARMVRYLDFNDEIAAKLKVIMNSVTEEPYFRDFTEEEVEFIRGLVKEYKERYGVSIVDRMANFYGAEARAYLRDFEVV